MASGALAIVEAWQEAVNAGCADRVRALSADQVLVLGPHGTGAIASEDLGEWMIRSGFSATPKRWFCGADGTVVVEQAARWMNPTGAEVSRSTVATHFKVEDERVVAIRRHAELPQALEDASLSLSDELEPRP